MTLKLIDTFSGIGGFSFAAEKLVGGFETVAFVECEPFCQKILKQHWPTVPIYEDIKTYQPKPYSADVVCGGFPCQDISVAGQGKGITEETRSGLFFQLMRVIRLVQPKYVVLENVAAILNNGLGIVLGELAEAGFDCEWSCIPASAVGACHQRDRWWLVAYNQSERARKHKSGLRGQLERRDLQTDRDTNQEISSTANTNNDGSFSTPNKGGNKETNGGTSKRKDTVSDIKRSSESKISGNVQFNASNTEGSERNEFQTFREHGELGTQGIPRNSNGSENTPRWRNTAHGVRGDWREWSVKPIICRNDDGLTTKLDRAKRLKALGNSIVPQVAAIPLQRVLDLYQINV